MNNVIVTNKAEFTDTVLAGNFDFAIGILDKNQKTSPSDNSILRFFFFDDLEKNEENIGDPPSEGDIQNIIDTIQKQKIDNPRKKVLVFCEGGVSRSAAVAIGLSIMRHGNVELAFKEIEKNRSIMWPNDLILEHFDNLLNLNNELIKFNENWKNGKTAEDQIFFADQPKMLGN